ncbi:MAG: enoyl-CoA hydratase/isomerase family protein [Anaerolineae bacterium]
MKALDLLDTDFDALVIGNDAERFCVGANLFMMAMAVQSGQLDQLEAMIKQGQDVYMALRHASKPVVVAPHNMALGGGAEITMAGARIVAHAELYAGLVEVGVGIIPAWERLQGNGAPSRQPCDGVAPERRPAAASAKSV